MGDDLGNEWGHSYISSDTKRLPLLNDANAHTVIRNTVNQTTGSQFVYEKAVASGSDGNRYCIDQSISGMNTLHAGLCLFAAGSYVTGDMSALQMLSTSSFDVGGYYASITPPIDELTSMVARNQTVALPYFIPCAGTESKVEELEDQCMTELHLRCLAAALQGKPIRALFLELVLAGNGAVLSDRALCRLSAIARHHHFRVIVDEIMTGGRCGPTMLLTQSKPQSFQDCVSFITMGKWLGVGLVLRNRDFSGFHDEQNDDFASMAARGNNTRVGLHEVIARWRKVEALLENIPNRRLACVKKLKVSNDMCWGSGLLIVAGVSIPQGRAGMKSRFLPMLSNNKFEFGKVIRKGNHLPTRSSCADDIHGKVSQWLDHSRTIGGQSDRRFCQMLADGTGFTSNGWAHSTQWKQMLMANDFIPREINQCIGRAVEQQMVEMKTKGRKRLRSVVLLPVCTLVSNDEAENE